MIKYDIRMRDRVINNCYVEKSGNYYSIIVDGLEMLKIGDAMILVLNKYIDDVAADDFIPYTTCLETLWEGDM